MTRRTKGSNGWYAYMEAHSLFDADDPTLIRAKKDYHNLWKREWRARNREVRAYYKPFFETPHNKLLIETAQKHEVSPTAFIQQATLAQLHSTAMTPQVGSFRKIVQVLNLILNQLSETKSPLQDHEKEELQYRLSALELWIKEMYFHPPNLQTLILQTIKDNPHFIPDLLKALNLNNR